MTTHASEAIAHLEKARSAISGLAELRTGEHSSKAVAAFYDEIGQQFKQAEVEALISIGEALRIIAGSERLIVGPERVAS